MSKRYPTVKAMCAAYAEYDTAVYRVKSQDPSRPIIQSTRTPMTVPPKYDHWQDIKRVFAKVRQRMRLSGRMPLWLFDLWLEHRVHLRSLRELSKGHNSYHEDKIGKSALASRFKRIDQMTEQAMCDLGMWTDDRSDDE